MTADTIVIGGGLVGAAIAYGIAREGESVTVLDEGDVAFRASRGNFGLVWVQSKGLSMPEYARWTRRSADLWPGFAETLCEETGVSTNYYKPGGAHICLSEEEFEEQAGVIRRMNQVHGAEHYGGQILSRAELDDILPGLGPEVVGGTYSPHDGHASPLYLMRALHAAFLKAGGQYQANARAQEINRDGEGFAVTTPAGTFKAAKIVLAAGLGNRRLGPMVGLDVPVNPLKGQILVTERARPFLSMPTHVVRQTEEGSVLIGDSHEDEGFDTRSKPRVMAEIAARAIRAFPFLKDLRVVRSWAALRVMSADGFPIYQQSERQPGAFAINCHSGVTLAGAHALALAPMIVRGRLEEELSAFSVRRFDVQAR
ncbi:FAD-binding oxidoreductase [Afifella sp. IM 167]|uniref:NAD(P)/FAD-dependent oxidoreductase n=1 Tax=Afifella sp. IM 167 TaxID=2033586 RepID=UPI001CCFFAF1|nr:FAD-dependent oxidoreductase [Afifella sp. IM 167]MBZ8134504.1 FAD-dependent oxidoreductase [Afifella sp. IM 167]